MLEQSNDLELEIPDGAEEGITSLVAFTEQGRLRDISITVDIEHEYLGDVEVHLRSPNGKLFLLQNRSLGSQTQLQKTYTMVNTPSLKQLMNLDIMGEWTLWVLDLSPMDTGSLKSWSLQLKY